MDKIKLMFLGGILTMLTSCFTDNVRNWSDEKINQWFENSEWTRLDIRPDSSVDVREFVEQNVLSPENWKTAYEFIRKGGFSELPQGKYDLNEDGVFATVTDYETKDSSLFEAHRKYIDIQYVSCGKEIIEIGTSEEKIMETEYDETKDIEFFRLDHSEKVLADSTKFLVLFPKDAHMPCMRYGENKSVRKIVVKIPYVNK